MDYVLTFDFEIDSFLIFYPAIIEFRVWKNDYKYNITLNRRNLEIGKNRRRR